MKTSFGWHVIRCDKIVSTDAAKPQIEASHILFKVEASDATRAKLEEKVLAAQKTINKKGIEAAAKELEMEVMDTDWVAHDAQYIPGVGQNRQMLSWMIKAKAKSVSDIIRDQQNRSIITRKPTTKESIMKSLRR